MTCTHYRVNGSVTDRMPYDISTGVEPVYDAMPGWGPLESTRPMPEALDRYVARIEKATGVPVRIISTGPDRAETLIREGAHAVH